MSLDEIRQPPRAWAELRLEMYWASTGDYPQGMPRTRPAVAPFRLWGVTRGSVEVAYAAETVRGSTGDWLLLPALVQRQRLAPGTVLTSLAIESTTAAGAALLRAIRPQRLAPPPPELVAAGNGLLAWAQAHAVHQPNQRLRLLPVTATAYGAQQALLCRLAGVLAGCAPRAAEGTPSGASADPRLRQLWTALAAHAAAAFPPVALMESTTGLGWRRLEQLCRRDWGQSPREVHQGMRLNEAYRRLGDDERPIKEVARALGFASADRFSHWLRRATGRSPQQWRLRNRP